MTFPMNHNCFNAIISTSPGFDSAAWMTAQASDQFFNIALRHVAAIPIAWQGLRRSADAPLLCRRYLPDLNLKQANASAAPRDWVEIYRRFHREVAPGRKAC
jgi:hypothetical protein